MYTQIFFVTSVRGIFLPPQIAASESLKAFGAKIPTPFFLPFAFFATLPAAFFVALTAAFVAFVIVVFVVVVGTVVFVDFVIAIKRLECKHALSLE